MTDIMYGEILSKMEAPELLLQLILRKDLERPKRQAQLGVRKVFDEICAKTEVYIAQLDALGVPNLTNALNSAYIEYKEGVELAGTAGAQ